MAGPQEKGGQEGGSTISWRKFFFPPKIGTVKFLQVKNIWDLSLFIEQDISDEKFFLNLSF